MEPKTKKVKQQQTITHNNRIIYLNNKELLVALRESKELGKMSDTLAKMLTLLCARYATKGNWVNYTYNTDMQSYAMLMLVKTYHRFDPDKGSNPFAFFTQCIKHSFIQYLNQEKKHRDIRDKLIIEQGLSPSYGYDDDNDYHIVEDEQDFEYNRNLLVALDVPVNFEETGIPRDELGIEIDPIEDLEDLSYNDIQEI